MKAEAIQHDVFPSLDRDAIGHHPCPATLADEREYVASNENPGQLVDADHGIFFAFDSSHDSAQPHVNRGCEQGGCDEDIAVLLYERRNLITRVSTAVIFGLQN